MSPTKVSRRSVPPTYTLAVNFDKEGYEIVLSPGAEIQAAVAGIQKENKKTMDCTLLFIVYICYLSDD